MRMRLSVRHDDSDDSRAALASAAVVPVVEDEDERGAWGEGCTHLVYHGWLPRYTLTLDATPDALVYRRLDRRYPNGTYACTYRWCDVVHTNYVLTRFGEREFSLHLWLPADANVHARALAGVDLPPGLPPPRWEDQCLPATRAVVDLVNRHTRHLPYIWVPATEGGYTRHDRSRVIALDWGRDPRTRIARWVRPYSWDAR